VQSLQLFECSVVNRMIAEEDQTTRWVWLGWHLITVLIWRGIINLISYDSTRCLMTTLTFVKRNPWVPSDIAARPMTCTEARSVVFTSVGSVVLFTVLMFMTGRICRLRYAVTRTFNYSTLPDAVVKLKLAFMIACIVELIPHQD